MHIVFQALSDNLKNGAYLAPKSTIHLLEIESPILADSVDNFEGDTGHTLNTEDFLSGGTITWP